MDNNVIDLTKISRKQKSKANDTKNYLSIGEITIHLSMSPDQNNLCMSLSYEWNFDLDDNVIENIQEIVLKRFPELLNDLLQKTETDE